MEKINNIFLNYKTYGAFQRDLRADKISPSSIAFIQDNRRIWAHGKEYACNNLTIVDNGKGSISFVDSLGNTLLALSADPNGYVNVSGITDNAYDVFISKGDLANYIEIVEQLKRDFEKYKAIVTGGFEKFVIKDELLQFVTKDESEQFAKKDELNQFVAKDELENEIKFDSTNPVQSRTIYQALEGKQDNLVAGAGISIQGNTISAVGGKMVTLTKQQYQQLVESGQVDNDTYYFTYEGNTDSNEWHFGDSFPITFTGTWEFGGTFPITFTDTWGFGGKFPITLS